MKGLGYQDYLQFKDTEFEEICKRCGACCGVDNDPCVNLMQLGDNKYVCRDYKNRIGVHLTAGGNKFHCIPIRVLLKQSACPPGCAYSKET
ncbi:MAG: hypothetical protein HQ572_05205 [Candidatus Omnitrophica bacterium]|nr:hypothetical protein [Candidatus Omnitrophota bacterium]